MHLSRPIFVRPIAISPHPSNPRILITGALGQIGSELCVALRQKYGADSVVATDIRRSRDGKMLSTHVADGGPFQYLDVQDATAMRRLVIDHRVDWLIHNSSIMSAKGELYPNLALDMNIAGTRHALEVAREMHLRVFIPSTIAVFGPSTQPKENTPDHALRDPSTVYGITKQFLEQLGTYYHKTFGVDFRSLRYPGILSHRTLPGGGTTDYAIHAIRAAARHPECPFSCGLAPYQALPMMHMEDCIRATLQVLEAPAEKFPDPSRRVYNVGSMSFSPAQLETEIRKYVPAYTFRYEPNHLQTIAETWPHSVNDQCAHSDWGWTPKYSFSDTVREMLEHFRSSSAQE